MSVYEVLLHDGPAQADLLRASKTARRPVRATFHTDEGVLEAELEAAEPLDGATAVIAVRGKVLSGAFKGRSFVGTYDPEARKGSLNLATSP